MRPILIIIALILMIIAPSISLDIPGIQLTSDTVVGNILYAPLSIMSMAVLVIMVLLMV